MVTIILLLTIVATAVLGTLPLFGPILSGALAGFMAAKKEPALVIGFLGAIIGGVFCRILFSYSENTWHQNLITLFGSRAAHYTEIIIRGNLFSLVLYFGLIGLIGAYAGIFLSNRRKKVQ
ncbi:MAG: hypothetical protein PHI72_09800 [Atribacterota bacterium]|nr:hypothetical protein [Atribacterota bacterium]MDD5637289.1 hypothetical protein [Atribacterota bacterium]